jgi:hypothetical protein
MNEVEAHEAGNTMLLLFRDIIGSSPSDEAVARAVIYMRLRVVPVNKHSSADDLINRILGAEQFLFGYYLFYLLFCVRLLVYHEGLV